MTEAFNKFKRLLDELFRFEGAFRIYRIMKRERAEGSSFLVKNLVPRVCEEPEPSSSSVAASPK